jgi:hypothetical protein
MKKTLALSGMLAASLISQAVAGPYDAWSNYRNITINTTATGGGANVAATVTNFPVLVRLSNVSFATGANVLAGALANGADVRIATATGDSALTYEIESWTSTAAAIWVKVPAIAGNANTSIRLYWGLAAQTTASSSSAVFDTTNGYVAVWHMAGTGNAIDATANAFTGTDTQTEAAVGALGGARKFTDGVSSIQVANNTKFNILQNLTVSAWVNSDDWSAHSYYIVAKGSGMNGNAQYALRDNSTGVVLLETAPTTNQISMPDPATGEWLGLHATYGGGFGKIYLNGDLVNTIASTADLNVYTAAGQGVGIGRRPSGSSATDHWFGGIIDEVRIQKALRDSSWIRLDYQLSKPASTAVTLGLTSGANTIPDVPTAVLATPSGAIGSGQVTISWTAPALNGGAAITAYTVTSLPGTATCATTTAVTCNITGLTPGTAYTFTVKATNSVGVGPASQPVSATPTVGILHNEKSFAVSGSRAYTFVIPAAERTTLTILDTYGRAVWSKNLQASTEVREITWDGSTTKGIQASAGMYMVRMTRANGARFEGTVTLKP